MVWFHQECVPQDLVCDSDGQPAPITKPSKRLPHESKMRLQLPVGAALVKRLLVSTQTPNILEYHRNINDDPNTIQTSFFALSLSIHPKIVPNSFFYQYTHQHTHKHNNNILELITGIVSGRPRSLLTLSKALGSGERSSLCRNCCASHGAFRAMECCKKESFRRAGWDSWVGAMMVHIQSWFLSILQNRISFNPFTVYISIETSNALYIDCALCNGTHSLDWKALTGPRNCSWDGGSHYCISASESKKAWLFGDI